MTCRRNFLAILTAATLGLAAERAFAEIDAVARVYPETLG